MMICNKGYDYGGIHLNSIVSTSWLAENTHNPKVRIVDCRFALGDPTAGRNAYEASHLPNATYFDLDQDLSNSIGEHGGRHPLPDIQELSRKLGASGIGNDSIVVAYDDQGGMFAARFWWLMRFMGHHDVAILDGGYSKWMQEGHPTTSQAPQITTATFTPHVNHDLMVDMETVKKSMGTQGITIIDSRDAKRFTGEEETIDPIAGHIPSAKNYFWKGVLTDSGEWKSAEALKEHFSNLSMNDEIIVYCGSGVTACPNVIALERAGYTNVRLYAGSWSDWITYKDNPIATGNE